VPHLYDLEATNPCVTGDTLVATPQGWRRADSLGEGDEICTVLGTGRVATVEVNKAMPVYDLHLSDGAVVRVTASHQFHVREAHTQFFKPRRLDQLKTGDWVRVSRSVTPENPVPARLEGLTDREYGFLVGILLGDRPAPPYRLSEQEGQPPTQADDEAWHKVTRAAFAKVYAAERAPAPQSASHAKPSVSKPNRVLADWVKSLPLEPAFGPEKHLPDLYVNSNRAFLTGLLDGLFSADGRVDLQSPSPAVQFQSSSLALAQQVRRILLMFGIHGHVRPAGLHASDGPVAPLHHAVCISGDGLGRFFEQIQLSHPAKRMQMEEAALRSNFTGGNWAARVVKVVPAGVATVYDLYEPKSDTWITEGYVSRGCGEQWLGPYENCCLGSINLCALVQQPFTAKAHLAYERLPELVANAVRMLDNVLDLTHWPLPQQRQEALRKRRIGLGFTGLGDALLMLGQSYGSEQACQTAAQMAQTLRDAAYRASVQLAQEKGAFPLFQAEAYLSGTSFATRLPPELQTAIRQHGLRNSHLLCVAPAGTISLAFADNVSNGIEPVFAWQTRRRKRETGEVWREYLVEDHAYRCYRHLFGQQTLPPYFVTALDLSAQQHLNLVAAVAPYVDAAISKTVNVAADYPFEDFQQLYWRAWESGLKGLTTYRPNQITGAVCVPCA